MFINDAPLANSKDISHSASFANDLGTIFLKNFQKNWANKKIHKSYLENLASWVFQWRLKMNVFHKSLGTQTEKLSQAYTEP